LQRDRARSVNRRSFEIAAAVSGTDALMFSRLVSGAGIL